MTNRTSFAITAMALMLAAAFIIVIDDEADGDIGDVDDEFTEGNVKYKITSKGDPKTVSVVGNTLNSPTELKISEKITNTETGTEYTVTAIGDNAFRNCTMLLKITMPDSVTSIGIFSFNNCTSLSELNISNSITYISRAAFSNCILLLKINIPNSVTTIGNEAFNSCKSLSEINIPNSVTSIGDYVFTECTSLEILKIGACNITSCDFSFEKGIKYICIAKGATGLSGLLKNYEFCDSQGKKLDLNEIDGMNFKYSDGKMREYDGPIPEPENNDPAGPNIGLIIGIIVAIVAVVGVGAYFFVRLKKQ